MAPRRPPSSVPLVVFALLMAWCAGLMTALADRLWPAPAVWPWLALLPLLLLLAVGRPSHWGRRREARLIGALRLLSLAPGVLIMLMMEGEALKLVGLPQSLKMASGRWAMGIFGLIFAVPFAVALGGAARRLMRTGTQRRLAPWMVGAGLLLSAGLSVAGAVRLRAHPHRYLDSLERVGTMAPAQGTTTGRFDTDAGEMRFTRSCQDLECAYGPSGDKSSVSPALKLPNGPVTILRDRHQQAVVVSTPGGQLFFTIFPDTRKLAQLRPGLRQLAPRLGPPPFWLASAVGGLGAALVLLLRGRRWARLVRQLRYARGGRVCSGWVRPDDGGEDLPLPAGHGFREGAAVTVLHSEQGEGYRDGAALHEIVEGSRSDNAHRAEGRLRWHQSMAAAVALVMAAPLLAARLMGLL